MFMLTKNCLCGKGGGGDCTSKSSIAIIHRMLRTREGEGRAIIIIWRVCRRVIASFYFTTLVLFNTRQLRSSKEKAV